MRLVQIPVGVTPCQVDDFPSEVKEEGKKPRSFERSVKGSLHIRPASTKSMTDDELEHLRTSKEHRAWGRRLIEVKVEVAKAPAKSALKMGAKPKDALLAGAKPREDAKPKDEPKPEGSRRGRSG